MPIYEAQCKACGKYQDYLRDVKDYLDTPDCCGSKTNKVIRTAPKGYVMGNFQAFKSTVDGSIIESNRDLKAHNERNNVVSMSDGYSTEQMMSDSFGCRKMIAPDLDDIKDDVGIATQMINNGYKPKVEMYDEQI